MESYSSQVNKISEGSSWSNKDEEQKDYDQGHRRGGHRRGRGGRHGGGRGGRGGGGRKRYTHFVALDIGDENVLDNLVGFQSKLLEQFPDDLREDWIMPKVILFTLYDNYHDFYSQGCILQYSCYLYSQMKRFSNQLIP